MLRAMRGSSSRSTEGAVSRAGCQRLGCASRSGFFSVTALLDIVSSSQIVPPCFPKARAGKGILLPRRAVRFGELALEGILLPEHFQEAVFQRAPAKVQSADRPAVLGHPLAQRLAEILSLARSDLKADQ